MTTRKLNMIKLCTYLNGFTFEDILKYVESVIDVNRYTAKQIAAIMEICKPQNDMGYNKCGNEFGLW